MKPIEIYKVMDLAKRARRNGDIFNPLFVGAPGLGKTEIVQQWCKQANMPFIVLTSALLEPPDVRGFPNIQLVNGRQRMTTAIPEFWPTEGEGVIILEEVNRGNTSIMNCWMGLTDKRRGFDNYVLPEGWIVVGCINPETSEFDVNTMDPAFKDRFEMFQVEYDKNTFVEFMRNTKWNETLMLFVESNAWNYVNPEDIGNAPGTKYISPRTLSKLNAVLNAGTDNDDEHWIYESVVGKNVGRSFYNFKYEDHPVMFEDLKNNKRSALKKLRTFSDPTNYKNGFISITIRDIVEKKTIEDDLLVEVTLALPVDQSLVLIKQLEFARKDNTILRRLCDEHPEVLKVLKASLK